MIATAAPAPGSSRRGPARPSGTEAVLTPEQVRALLSPAGVTVEYSFPGNTTSVTKVDFWNWAPQLFGVTLPPEALWVLPPDQPHSPGISTA